MSPAEAQRQNLEFEKGLEEMPYLDRWVSQMLTASDVLTRDALPGSRGSPYTTIQTNSQLKPRVKYHPKTMLHIGGASSPRRTLDATGKISYKDVNDGSLVHPGVDYPSRNLSLSTMVDFYSDETITLPGTDYYRILRKSGNFNDGKKAEEMANRIKRWERKAGWDGDFILDDFMEED